MNGAPAIVLAVERLRLQTGAGFSLDLGPWRLHAGQRQALIGRNGAGKSTLLEALLGLRRAALAEGRVLGRPLADLAREPALRRRCGVLLQQVEFSAFARVRELLTLHAAMYGAGWPELHRRLDLAEIEALRPHLLSRGQRQRLQLYLALAHRPALALLDEPLTGLDRRYVDALAATLRGPELAHAAMLIVGHTPEELALCDGYLWLHEGRLADSGATGPLLARHLGPWRAHVLASDASQIDTLLSALAAAGVELLRIERPQSHALLLFAAAPLDAVLVAHEPAGGWLALELGRSQLSDLLLAGPRRVATHEVVA